MRLIEIPSNGIVRIPIMCGDDTVGEKRIDLRHLPTIDAVEVKTLEAWLYEIATNNTNTYLCDACEEIISRLDGLRVFAKERRSHHDSLCDQRRDNDE